MLFENVDVNITALLVLPLVSFVVGFFYYGPLFGNKWIELTGITPEKARANIFSSYLGAYITAFFMTYVLANLASFLELTTFNQGAQLGAWLWFGFTASTQLTNSIFEQTDKRIFAINSVYHLINAILIGGLLITWV